MNIPGIILQQLGGHKFVVMTGSKNFVADGNTLRMTLAKNGSRANRLYITLEADDTYTMRFFKYTAPRFNSKTYTFSDEKITEVKTIKGVYCDQLQELFAEVTKLYTRL